VDGATPEALNQLRAEGKLPHIDRLIRSGAWGRMESLAARRVLRPRPRRGYWSPIVWASLATGQVPEKHGIVDFLLPLPGTSLAWVGNDEGPPRADLRLPEISGQPPHTLRLRLRSAKLNGSQDVEILLNGMPLSTVSVPVSWKELSLPVREESWRPGENRIDLVFSQQSRPADRGQSKDRRQLAGALAFLEVVDSRDEVVISFDPVYQRFSLGRGFRLPEADLVEAQSSHWKVHPVWSLLGKSGIPVGVVGYWSTWPAYEVNGFLVSSAMGMRGRRQKTQTHLTWPPELAAELQPLAPDDTEMEDKIAQLYPPSCLPARPKSLSVFESVLWQDEFYFRIARELLPTMRNGFFSVYFESIDVGGHSFLPFRHGAELPPGCPESVRGIVEQTYLVVDRWIGELTKLLPENATVLLVSDHGMVTADNAGYHAPYGVVLASGPAIRAGTELAGASVLDVAPTILQLLDQPIPFEMDGKVLVQAFHRPWLADHPPRYVDVETAISPEQRGQPLTDATEEAIERLKSIGYLQ
jgi:predicted AlkP superfamily phosphohydrolase/phosphomutase